MSCCGIQQEGQKNIKRLPEAFLARIELEKKCSRGMWEKMVRTMEKAIYIKLLLFSSMPIPCSGK